MSKEDIGIINTDFVMYIEGRRYVINKGEKVGILNKVNDQQTRVIFIDGDVIGIISTIDNKVIDFH